MLKYLAGLVLVFGLTVYVSIQDKRATEQATTDSTQANKGALVAKSNENHPQQNVPYSERNTPSWYRFFRWPDGPTTWVIVLTLLAIAEQARETAKATQAVRDSIPLQRDAANAALLNAEAVINAERPWVVVFYHSWKDGTFGFSAANKGRTPANIISFAVGYTCLSNAKQLPPEPEYGPEIFPTTNLLMPSESEWGTELALMSRDDCQSKMEKCRDLRDTAVQFPQSGEKLPIFYFRIKYSVVIADKANTVFGETRACYSVSPYDGSMSHCGGEAYNHYE